MTQFFGLRVKTYIYLIDDCSENKTAKSTKEYAIKENLNLKIIKNCLEATQFVNKINYLGKYEINVDSIKKEQKEFIKTIN